MRVPGVGVVSVSALLPTLLTVIVPVFTARVAGLVSSDAGDPEKETTACVPAPFMVAASAGAVLITCRLVVRVPAALGVNVTLIVQLAPAAKLAPQVLVCAKSVVFPVLNPMLEISSEALVAVFVSVTGCEAVVVPGF